MQWRPPAAAPNILPFVPAPASPLPTSPRLSTLFSGNASVVAARATEGRRTDERSFGLDAERRAAAAAAVTDVRTTGRYAVSVGRAHISHK